MQPSHHPIIGWDANLSLWEIFISRKGLFLDIDLVCWGEFILVDINTLYNVYFPIKEVMHDTCIFHIERTLLFLQYEGETKT